MEAPCRPASLEWFAATCWNAALHASQAKHWQPCAVFFAACGTFYQAHPSPDLKALEFQKVWYMASYSAEVRTQSTCQMHSTSAISTAYDQDSHLSKCISKSVSFNIVYLQLAFTVTPVLAQCLGNVSKHGSQRQHVTGWLWCRWHS